MKVRIFSADLHDPESLAELEQSVEKLEPKSGRSIKITWLTAAAATETDAQYCIVAVVEAY